MLIINIVIILVAIVLIISVLMQQGNRAGLGTIGGGAETFFGKSKAKSYEGKLELITKISAAVFTLLVIVLAATYNRFGNTPTTVLPEAEPTVTVAPAEEATAMPEATVAAEATVAVEATVAAEAAVTTEPTVAAEAATVAPTVAAATAEPTPAAPLATEAPAASPAA
jgi:preprotein translocase subunit SecG